MSSNLMRRDVMTQLRGILRDAQLVCDSVADSSFLFPPDSVIDNSKPTSRHNRRPILNNNGTLRHIETTHCCYK